MTTRAKTLTYPNPLVALRLEGPVSFLDLCLHVPRMSRAEASCVLEQLVSDGLATDDGRLVDLTDAGRAEFKRRYPEKDDTLGLADAPVSLTRRLGWKLWGRTG